MAFKTIHLKVLKLVEVIVGRPRDHWRLRKWMKLQRKRNCYFHPSVEIIGRKFAFKYINIYKNVRIEREASLYIDPHPGAELKIEQEVYIGRNTNIAAYAPITIGAWTMIGPYCHINSGNHGMHRRDVPMKSQEMTAEPIVIHEDVWIGTHVVVTAGITIGRGAVIGAGSVVTKNIPPYEIWGGVPAHFIKKRPE